VSGPVYSRAWQIEDEACGACPFLDDCHPERISCTRRRLAALRRAEAQADKRGVDLLETKDGRWLAESAGLGE
jgi:hypothetical protein